MSRQFIDYPGGMAWPAPQHGPGVWALNPNNPLKSVQLAVCDDFGQLVAIPSTPAETPAESRA